HYAAGNQPQGYSASHGHRGRQSEHKPDGLLSTPGGEACSLQGPDLGALWQHHCPRRREQLAATEGRRTQRWPRIEVEPRTPVGGGAKRRLLGYLRGEDCADAALARGVPAYQPAIMRCGHEGTSARLKGSWARPGGASPSLLHPL